MAVKSLEDLNKEFMSESILNNSHSDKQQSEDLDSKQQVETRSPQKESQPDNTVTQNDKKSSPRLFRKPRRPKVRETNLPKAKETNSPKAKETNPPKERRVRSPEQRKTKSKRGVFSRVMDIFFLMALLVALISVFTPFGKEASREILGYSLFTVESSNMEDEMPKNSLILTRRIDPYNLKEGDNITFTREDSAAVTHKITDIYENYLNDGKIGFMTKGVNNNSTDVEIVREENVIGKVVISLPIVGGIVSHLETNNNIVLIILGILIGLFVMLNVVQMTKRANAGRAPATQTLSTPQERSPLASV